MQALTGNVARIIFAIPFGVFGILHFMNAGAMAGYVPGWLPFASFWVYLIGLALLAACVSFISGKMMKEAGLLLALMLLIFILTIHIPGVMAGGEQMQTSMTNLLKDLALAAAALMVAGQAEAASA